MRRVTTLVMATMIVIGCSAPAADGGSASPLAMASAEKTPMASAGSTPVATPDSTPMATPDSTPEATVGSTRSSAPAAELEVRWRADDPVGIPAVSEVRDLVRTDEGYVLITSRYADEDEVFEAWWSMDGRSWKLAHTFPGGQRIHAATAGGRSRRSGTSEGDPVGEA